MQTFKSFLTDNTLVEASGPTGAEWESIITSQINKLLNKPDHDIGANEISSIFPSYEEAGAKIAETFKNDLGVKTPMTQYGGGGGKSNLSSSWIEHGGTNGTPKTDMYTSNYNISLKKKGGSQLASGGTGESIATFYAALEYMGISKSAKKDISKIMDEIESKFTKVALDYSKTEIEKISKGAKIYQGDTEIELSSREKKEVEKFTETEAFHKKLNEELKKVMNFEANPEFMKWYVFECMSGLKKFSDKRSIASVCVTFDADNGGITTIPVTSDGKSSGLTGTPTPSSELISKAKSVKVYSAWKSSKGNPYSTIRVSGYDPTKPDKIPLLDCTLDSIIKEELKNDEIANQVHTTLNEELVMLDEFKIIKKVISKLQSIGRNAINWLQGFFKKVMKKVKMVFARIKQMGEKMFDALFEFLGIEISSVKESVSKELQGFIYGMTD